MQQCHLTVSSSRVILWRDLHSLACTLLYSALVVTQAFSYTKSSVFKVHSCPLLHRCLVAINVIKISNVHSNNRPACWLFFRCTLVVVPDPPRFEQTSKLTQHIVNNAVMLAKRCFGDVMAPQRQQEPSKNSPPLSDTAQQFLNQVCSWRFD